MKKIYILMLLSYFAAGLFMVPVYPQNPLLNKSYQALSHYDAEEQWIEIMFAPESKVRMRNGDLTDLTTNALLGVDQVLNTLSWHEWHRLTDIPEATIDAWETNGERNSGTDIYNLNNIYRLKIPTGHNPWLLSEKLEALTGIYRAMPVPRPVPLPTPPNYQTNQGYLNPATSNPSGIDAAYAWTQAGGTGTGVTICDIEYSWNYNHADVTKAVGSQVNPNPITDPFGNNNHGTAVIGELVADNNGWGTTGICYNAGLKTCGTYWFSTWNPAGAIGYAIAALAAGDIILIEQQWDYSPTSAGLYIPLEWYGSTSPNAQTNNAVYAAIVNAIANGIHVVEAGGNGNVNTGTMTWYGNSGAIIVGAGGATILNDRQKLSFSSYGTRFDLQGWGENVFTTGYGSYYSAEGVNYYYTSTFNGTSSASPIVAGALACTEGYYYANVSATPPTPAYMRNLLVTYGTAQVTPPTGNIGPRPNVKASIQSIPINTIDFGDAPDGPYPTLLASNGASHVNTGLKLGLLIDAEANGQPNGTATGDDQNPAIADDEDGVQFVSLLTQGQMAIVQVMASAPGFLNAWIDFNKVNVWADPGEQIFLNVALNAGMNALNFNVPANAMPGLTFARFRFNAQGALPFYGPAQNGEVEDYQVYIEEAILYDWGDAPDQPYPTLAINGGANHRIDGITFLGTLIDDEPNGQPDPMALGDDMDILYPPPNDDEDGVLFTSALIPNQMASVTVITSAQGFLNAWIDFNGNGLWSDPGDQIFTNLLLPPGIFPLNFMVPASATTGLKYARFRFCSLQGIGFAGTAPNGEVEDYTVIIEPPPDEFDWGDAPDGPYPTLGLSMGANHRLDGATYLGAMIDSEPDGQPDPAAMGDDMDILYPPPNDDEDGVVFMNSLMPNQSVNISVVASVQGFLNVWIDFNLNGSWADAGEHVFMDLVLLPGSNLLTFVVPPNAVAGLTFARFRFCTQQGLSYMGSAQNGEVEDYAVPISPEPDYYDWGDAPDPNYPTYSANGGASHMLDGVTFLGALIDAEADGQPTPAANGDDLANLADEDGVAFLWPIAKGNPCKMKVNASVGNAFFNCWIDFNADGDWNDAREHVFIDLNLVAGDNYLTFVAPDSVSAGSTYVRCRFSHQAGLSYGGPAIDGEVEDYKVPTIVYGELKWSQPPDTLLPGIHATDMGKVADDWLCNGEVVTDLHWWGNYELNVMGLEKRGAGISHFILNIYSNATCLPNVLLKSYILPFNPALEFFTGLNNNEGSPIYRYDFQLPEPFIQVEDTTYWLSVNAISNLPTNPPSWRWQEANRWFYPILCGAAGSGTTPWQTITWPNAFMTKFSDMAFEISSWIVDTLYLQNINVTAGQTLCYNANYVIVVAGSGTTFTVQPGASATMIAGLKILYEPGTLAMAGSYMHGYITTTGVFCPRAPVITGTSAETEEPELFQAYASGSDLKVYPNPTTGTLILEIPNTSERSVAVAELYSSLGEMVLREEFPAQSKHRLSLSLQPPGVYILRVNTGKEIRTVKVIRQ